MIFTPVCPGKWSASDPAARRSLRVPLLCAGLYDFHVACAVEGRTRRSRHPLLRLVLRIHLPGDDGEGYPGDAASNRLVGDRLRADDPERLWQFTRTVGLEDCYTQGVLDAAQCEGQSGTCKIGVVPGQPDGHGGRHPDRNRVIFYVCDPAQVGIYVEGRG